MAALNKRGQPLLFIYPWQFAFPFILRSEPCLTMRMTSWEPLFPVGPHFQQFFSPTVAQNPLILILPPFHCPSSLSCPHVPCVSAQFLVSIIIITLLYFAHMVPFLFLFACQKCNSDCIQLSLTCCLHVPSWTQLEKNIPSCWLVSLYIHDHKPLMSPRAAGSLIIFPQVH